MKNLEDKVEALIVKNKDLTQHILKTHTEAVERMTMLLRKWVEASL